MTPAVSLRSPKKATAKKAAWKASAKGPNAKELLKEKPFLLALLFRKGLDVISEARDPNTGQVDYTSFYVFDKNDSLSFGHVYKPKEAIDGHDFDSSMKHVADEDIYPLLPEDSSFIVWTEPIEDEDYIKRPRLSSYVHACQTQCMRYIPHLLLSEALIMERLAKHPHPNIVRYHGVRVQRGRITGIVLERHGRTLLSHVQQKRALDTGVFMNALASAVSHLHSIDLAHNDINPDNIMVREDSMPVLIDFGSCQPPGVRLISGGTPGWMIGDAALMHSKKENDVFALGKVWLWLMDPKIE